MGDLSSIAPTGYQVVSTGAQAQRSTSSSEPRWLQFLSRGLDAYVDLEVARETGSVADRGDIVAATGQNSPAMTAGAVVANLSPIQWAGIAVVGALAVGMFAGWFK